MADRYRCTACGNLTRFDVTTTRRTQAFHHYTVGGDLTVEEVEVLSEHVESVECRWCGAGSVVETVAVETVAGEVAEVGRRDTAMARDSAAPEGPCAGAGAPAGRPTSAELPDDPVLAALAPALRAALRYARMSPVAAPPTLRDLTRLDRDRRAVLAIARSAVEADDGFRAAVAATTTEAEVGVTGWAWLLRSPGWDERLIEVVLAGRHATGDRDRDRDERSAARRLEAAERRLAAAEVRARADAESALPAGRGGAAGRGCGDGTSGDRPTTSSNAGWWCCATASLPHWATSSGPRPSSARSGRPAARPRPA